MRRIEKISGVKPFYNVSQKELLTFKAGGSARCVSCVQEEEKLKGLLYFCKEENIPFTVLGRGANTLPTQHYGGLVVKLSGRLAEVERKGEVVYAKGGASVSSIAKAAYSGSLTGAEFLSAFPASAGGAIAHNSGCFGKEIKDCLLYVWATDGRGFKRFGKEELNLSYRSSALLSNGYIVTEGAFKFDEGFAQDIYSLMKNMLAKKKALQPLDYPSAGSVFLRQKDVFPGKVIEEAGLKGLSVGGARVSEKHANFIINSGGASAKDVKLLIERVQRRVYDTHKIWLTREPLYLGEKIDTSRFTHPYEI